MDPWQKESLGLQIGDFILWQDAAVKVEGRKEGPYRVFFGPYMDPILGVAVENLKESVYKPLKRLVELRGLEPLAP